MKKLLFLLLGVEVFVSGMDEIVDGVFSVIAADVAGVVSTAAILGMSSIWGAPFKTAVSLPDKVPACTSDCMDIGPAW
jgi:hypothetical protein